MIIFTKKYEKGLVYIPTQVPVHGFAGAPNRLPNCDTMSFNLLLQVNINIFNALDSMKCILLSECNYAVLSLINLQQWRHKQLHDIKSADFWLETGVPE